MHGGAQEWAREKPPPLRMTLDQNNYGNPNQMDRPISSATNIIAMYAGDDSGDNYDHSTSNDNESYDYLKNTAFLDEMTPTASSYTARDEIIGGPSRPLPARPLSPPQRTTHNRSPLPPTPASVSSVKSSSHSHHTTDQSPLRTRTYGREYVNCSRRSPSDRFIDEDPSQQRYANPRPLRHTPSTASSFTSASSSERLGINPFNTFTPKTPPPWSPPTSIHSSSSPSGPAIQQQDLSTSRHRPDYSYSFSSTSGSSLLLNGRDDQRKVSGPRGKTERLDEMRNGSSQSIRRDPPQLPTQSNGRYMTSNSNNPYLDRSKTPPSTSRHPPLPVLPFDSRFGQSQKVLSDGPNNQPKAEPTDWLGISPSNQSQIPRRPSPMPRMASQKGARDVQFTEDRKGGGLRSPVMLSSVSNQGKTVFDSRNDQEDPTEFSLLSTIARLLAESVPRDIQIKGSISYPYSFTGKDVVSTIQKVIPKDVLAWSAGLIDQRLDDADERRIALLIAKSLKSQLFFHEVDWDTAELQDGVEEVYMFLEDTLTGSRSDGNNHGKVNDFERELNLVAYGGNASERQGNSIVDGMEELPTGVFTAMTSCYSPLCGQADSPSGGSCYSSSCPRSQIGPYKRKALKSLTLISSMEHSKMVVASGVTHMAVAWADTVPKEFLASISKAEVKRQNAILELIQKEEEFLHDLELLENLFLARLEKPDPLTGDPPPISIGPERVEFIQEVFSNHKELVGLIQRLVEKLHVRQREDYPMIGSIGDIFLDAALQWGSAFETNMTNFPIAKYRINREAQINSRFKTFLETCRRDPACHRLPMDNFLQRATTRLPRYNLHFKSILQDTEEKNTDRESLARAMEIIDEQCKAIQKGVASAEVKVKIREYAYNLATKRNKAAVHMDLLNPERQLMHQGKVYRKPDFTDFEWQDLLAVLFDNYLVVTKTKIKEEGESISSKFILAKRPIPVEMIQLNGFNDASVSKSVGLSNFHLRSNADRDFRDLYPFTIGHIGARMEPLTLYVPSKAEREEWQLKLQKAIGLRTEVQEAKKIFEMHVISGDHFAIPPIHSLDPERPPPGVDSTNFHGIVTCAVPFATIDGRRLIAIGCADGVWIGLRTDPRSLRKVLHIKLVTQCAVLESFGIFVVLADKVLIAYSLEALVPSTASNPTPKPPQKLSGNRDVLFFSVGQLRDRTLLIYMKKKANESVFRALEPVSNSIQTGQSKQSNGGLFSKFGKDHKGSDWFRIYKTFFIPSEAYSMQFLRSKLCIVCAKGFEIINLDDLLPGTIPDFSPSSRDDPRIQLLAKRVETAKPLGMFKNNESEFLLCYDGFACYVDKRGEPIRLDHVIEWEGVPKSVAFRSPFILAFDSRFIEVRDSSSGQLVQLIKTQDLRYISDSSTTISSIEDEDQDAIICVQRIRHLNTKGAELPRSLTFDNQQVFQLLSTSYFKQLHEDDHLRNAKMTTSADSNANGNGNGNSRNYELNRMGTTATFRTYDSTTSGFI